MVQVHSRINKGRDFAVRGCQLYNFTVVEQPRVKMSEIDQPGLDNLHNGHSIHIHTLEHETMHTCSPPFLSCDRIRNACFCLHRRSAFAAEKGAEVWIKVYSGLGQLGTKKINYIATIMPGLKSECTRLLHLVLHASECRSAHCLHANCRKVKGLFVHGTICRTRAASGCIWCKKMWYILQLHALACRESECRVPRCKDLKQYLWEMQRQYESRKGSCSDGDGETGSAAEVAGNTN